MANFPLGIDEGGSHAIGATYPHTETGVEHIYRGGGKWQIFVAGNSADLSNFYTKSEIDASQAVQDASIASNTADLSTVSSTATSALSAAQAAIPATDKSAANGVASLGGDGKVPTAQLPDSVVSGIPDWPDITNKPTEFNPSSHTHAQSDITNLVSDLAAKLDSSSYTAADVLAKLLTVDGAGTGVDADKLDGYHASSFSLAGHDHTGVYAPFTHTHSEYLEIDVNSLSTATNYEVGTYLFGAEPGTGVELNASVTLYMDDNDDTCGCCADVDYRRAVTTTATDNTVLTGTWRFRGRAAGAGLYQRVA